MRRKYIWVALCLQCIVSIVANLGLFCLTPGSGGELFRQVSISFLVSLLAYLFFWAALSFNRRRGRTLQNWVTIIVIIIFGIMTIRGVVGIFIDVSILPLVPIFLAPVLSSVAYRVDTAKWDDSYFLPKVPKDKIEI
jgi:hypothetical protein